MLRYLRRFLRIYQGFVVSGAILLFGTVAIIFAVIPGVRATRELYGSLKEIEGETQALSGKLTFLEALSEDDIRERVMMLLSALPQEKSVPTILTTIEGLANQSGVSIIDMSLTNPGSLATAAATRQSTAEKKIGASTLPFSLTASGTYAQIRAFVGEINKVRRLFDVTSFDLSIGGTGTTQVRLSLIAFYQPLPTKVGNVQAPVALLSQKEEEVLGKVTGYPDVSQSVFQPLTPILSGGKRDPFAR